MDWVHVPPIVIEDESEQEENSVPEQQCTPVIDLLTQLHVSDKTCGGSCDTEQACGDSCKAPLACGDSCNTEQECGDSCNTEQACGDSCKTAEFPQSAQTRELHVQARAEVTRKRPMPKKARMPRPTRWGRCAHCSRALRPWISQDRCPYLICPQIRLGPQHTRRFVTESQVLQWNFPKRILRRVRISF